jgi:hypothetical protein
MTRPPRARNVLATTAVVLVAWLVVTESQQIFRSGTDVV